MIQIKSIPAIVVHKVRDMAYAKSHAYENQFDALENKLRSEHFTSVLGKDYHARFEKAGVTVNVYLKDDIAKKIRAKVIKQMGPRKDYQVLVNAALSDYEYRQAIGQAPDLVALVAEVEKLLK